MEKIKNLATKAHTAMMMRLAGVKNERENGDHLLEVLGTIIIAVVLLLLFRGYIVNLFNNAMTETNTQVMGMFNNGGAPAGGGGTTP